MVTVPAWADLILFGFFGYFVIAMICGCPYCFYPDMAWPVTLTKRLLADLTNSEET